MNAGAEGPSGARRLADLEDRVASRIAVLEEDHAALRRRIGITGFGVLAVLVFLLGGVVTGLEVPVPGSSSAPGTLRAERFVLVDDRGVERGTWGLRNDGSARLTLHDPAGLARLNLTILESGSPGLSFAGDDGQRRVVLGLLDDETGSLVFADRDGVPRAVLGLSRDQAASLLLADGDGATGIAFGLDGNGVGSVLLPDEPDPEAGTR